MPSYFESLSMVALEAWALGRPVLANGRCDVLKGQCIRSNAGLYYERFAEFVEALQAIEQNHWLRGALGRNGRLFFERTTIGRSSSASTSTCSNGSEAGADDATMEEAPGWLDRRREDGPAAEEVLAKLPSGRTRGAAARSTGVIQVHQVLATLGYGDAIGNEVSASSGCCAAPATIRDLRRDRRPSPRAADTRLPRAGRRSRRDNLLIHHFSLGSRASRTAFALPGRMALIYHNITPPEYFVGVHQHARPPVLSRTPRAEGLQDRCDLALGDSEFNRQELEALGFPRTAVLAVVPDFSHLDREPDWRVAGISTTSGRTSCSSAASSPNKRIEDFIRFFHAYSTIFNPRSRLLLVGSQGGFERYLASLHYLIGNARRVARAFRGPRHRRGAGRALRGRRLFLCASEHEGFCVPLVEAFHKEVPVLAYAATAVPATMDGAGVLFDDKTPAHVARVMDAIISDPALQDRDRAGTTRCGRPSAGQGFRRHAARVRRPHPVESRRAEPKVAFDFWHQFDAAQELEELRLYRPASTRLSQ